jgi:ribosomal protein S18 acetylase RimI-like enzyme
VTVEPLERGQCAAAVDVLASAFRDNPLNRAVIRGDPERRLRCNRHGMGTTLSASFGHALILAAPRCVPSPEASPTRETTTNHLAGALISAPPHHYPFPRPRLGRQLRCLLGQGFGVQKRWSQIYKRLLVLHPAEPHWYLSVLGVDPELQRRSVGRSLLNAWLRHVDSGPLPAYLETDREANLDFYAPAGFEVVRELRVLDIPIWCMKRPGRGRG